MTRGDKGKLFIRFVPLARLCAPCEETIEPGALQLVQVALTKIPIKRS